jgi:hypothetical protein
VDTAAPAGVGQLRFTLLDGGRPVPGRTVVVAAPPGCWYGIDLEPVIDDEDCPGSNLDLRRVGGFTLTLSVFARVEGGGWPPAELGEAGAALYERLWTLAAPEPPAEFAVEQWEPSPGEDWSMYRIAPWTTGGHPLDGGLSATVDADTILFQVKVWEARVRAGAEPWPQDWPAVNTVGGEPQPPRVQPHVFVTQAVVNVPPPLVDVPV